MFARPAYLLIPLALLVLPGCGDWPPIVNTAKDVQRLPETTTSIRARSLPDGDIPSLARLQQLNTLDYSGGYAIGPANITDQGLAALADLKLPHLETLTLGWCDDITDAGLAHLGRLQTITWLGLTSCPNITDAGLRELINAKNLTGLDLRACPNITDDGIQQLAAKKNWKEIMLGGCPKITNEGLTKLRAALPDAQVAKDNQEWGFHGPDADNPPWRKQKR